MSRSLSLDRPARELTPAPAPVVAKPPTPPPQSVSPQAPAFVVGAADGDAALVLARAIASRTTGSLCFGTGGAERRVLLREGDVVTCASTAEEESLIGFLGARGDLPRETVRRLAPKFAPFGRHAGAALVARGYLLQDQMWPTLRAHAEWLLGHVLQDQQARVNFEAQPPGRLAAEPSVFGGASGAEVFVEGARRIVAPAQAIEQIGGMGCRMGPGPAANLLDECALRPSELQALRDAAGRTLGEILEAAQEADFASAVFALAKLGVLEVLPAVEAGADRDEGALEPDASALDAEAIRERVRARLQLVEEGDYFAVLGVPRQATSYEIRRAFLELRRAFEPSRVLSRDLSDLVDDVRKIATVLEEAYEILKDSARRERYRRAIEVTPE